MESHSAQLFDSPSSSYPLAASRPISQFPTTLPPHLKDSSYFSNASSSYSSRSSTPLSMSLSMSSFSEAETESHSGQSPCVTSSPGPFTPREWAISSPSIPYSSSVEIYSRPTLPSLPALFPELDEREQGYRHHQPKHHGHVPSSHQQRRDHRRLSSYDYAMDIYSEHLTRRSGYHPFEYHEYQQQYQQHQRYPLPPPYNQYGDDVQAEHHHYASLRPQAHAQDQAQIQAQATSPSAPVSLHLTRSSSPSATLPSSFSASFPISFSPRSPPPSSSFSSSSFSSSSSSRAPSRPTTQHTQHTHRHHPYPTQRHTYLRDTNKREMFHSQSSLPPSPSHHTLTHHPHHPYHHSRNNSRLVPPREAPSPFHNIDFVQAKPNPSSSTLSSTTSSLPPPTSHFSVYSHNQSYQNLLSALPKSSSSTPKVDPAMERYSRFGSTSPPPQGPAHNTPLSTDPRNNMKTRSVPTPYGSPALTDEEVYSDWSRSPSLTRDTISMEYGSPQLRSMMEYFDALSEDGSDSTISLISDSSNHHVSNYSNSGANISSSSFAPTSTQNNSNSSKSTGKLLLCPVCDKAFKPSKNQNCNLRRHLKNVHDMSPTIHPRKCKWDSLPDGRVKDDKDRKERTRKSKRLWARKFRLRRKVEEAAEVLTMLNQAN